MRLSSVVLSGSGTWRVPTGITAGWVNAVGGAGAGQGHSTDGTSGGSGGGAGEFCLGVPIPLVPGTVMSVVPGSGGQGGNNSSPSTDGSATTFAGLSMLAGGSVSNANGPGHAGNGGGPRGAVGNVIPSSDGAAGTQESPTAFGGASGGTGEGLAVTDSGAGGQQIGEFSAPRVVNNGTGGHPSGSGGCSVFGAGGVGVNSGGGNNGGGYGAGSSGVAGDATTQSAGNGAGGVVMIFYFQP